MENGQLTLTDAWKSFWEKKFTCSGRTTREEFWLVMAIGYFAFSVFGCVGYVIDMQTSVNAIFYTHGNIDSTALLSWGGIFFILVAAWLVLCIPLVIRRLHDVGKSGWWILLGFIPLIGGLILFFWYIRVSDGDNQYGEAKKQDQLKFKDAVKRWWKKKFTISGRASRDEYWLGMTAVAIILTIIILLLEIIVVIMIVTVANGAVKTPGVMMKEGIIFVISILIICIGSLSVTIPITARRLHDIGRSGWWQLLCFVPMIGGLLLFFWFVKPSDADNQYGPGPAAAVTGTDTEQMLL